jgi:hypothetical protein
MKLLTLAIFSLTFVLAIPPVSVGQSLISDANKRTSPRYYCGVEQGIPATMVEFMSTKLVLIRWTTNFFASSFSPKNRCEVVSERLQRYYDEGSLNYLKTGVVNGLPVICAAKNAEERCTTDRILLTLIPNSDSKEVFNSLFSPMVNPLSGVVVRDGGFKVDLSIESLLKRALEKQKIQDYQGAEVIWDEIIKIKPDDAYVNNEFALNLQKQGKLEEAVKYYQKAISIDPNFVAAINNLERVQKELQIKQNPQIVALGEIKYLPEEQLTSTKRSIVRVFANFPIGNMSGTGFIIKREGNKALILTNRHVIFDSLTEQESDQVSIELYFGKSPLPTPSIPARILKRTELNDPQNLDLALLEVEVEGFPPDIKPLQISQGKNFNGTEISIIGHPSNRMWSVDKGVIQANFKNGVYIVEASLDIGSSGSPIFENNNRIVAMVSHIQAIAGGNIVCYAHSINTVIEILKTWGVEIP